ncbi:DUF3718 domain-containing protein [Aliiglaciecola sp. LCG003]|uniref:DUF3718 domain-containing protein n=1 Tax=Aliiglaciecola sp. LCG003 TaxID=3053655 RepID=UPI0025726347|nr:DUF3718 domain-containing protein [Aliiglaciecola sp. LCG003]WJG10370.1 DUF3718 domain-containing protein [Aliiglaciecola sp. LCG003]
MKIFSVRRVFTASCLFVALIGNNAMASLDQSTEAKLVKICHALKSNNQFQLHRAIKHSNMSYKTVARGLKCNGKSAFKFALMHQADVTAGYLAKRAYIDHKGMLAKR